jgi:hypothetical protein
MKYILPIVLTLLSLYSIIIVLKKIESKVLKNNVYRQSDIHKILKPFYSTKLKKNNKKTQMDEMLEKNSVKVIVLDDKAYWVFKNAFYTADFVDGDVDPETTTAIDTSDMSKKDIEKMLFILDKLGDGNNNDSGGTR